VEKIMDLRQAFQPDGLFLKQLNYCGKVAGKLPILQTLA